MHAEQTPAGSVLIVADNRDVVRPLADVLRQHGYRVALARTAASARKRLGAPAAPPVVLIDADLGGRRHGIELLAALRQKQPGVVCAIMASGVDGKTAVAALRAGACDYFNKSADPAALLPLIERCVAAAALQDEHTGEIAALRRAKEEAERANRGKSGFLATMSHELRTPLNAVIGFSEMMLREVLGPLGSDQYRAYAADIHDSGAHLLQIINDILDLSKAEAGKLELAEEVFEISKMLHSVCQLMSARLTNGGLTMALDLPPDLPPLRADERLTRQVLFNLVTNAIKFTPSGGRIEVSGRFDPNAGLMLAVSDTGVGIAPDDLPRILEPFEQVETSISRSHQGTGLGLPLVKAIMELHGGRLELQSVPAVGTRASITFPPQRAVFDPSNKPSRSAA